MMSFGIGTVVEGYSMKERFDKSIHPESCHGPVERNHRPLSVVFFSRSECPLIKTPRKKNHKAEPKEYVVTPGDGKISESGVKG